MRIFIKCPHCGKRRFVRRKHIGTNLWCFSCNNWFYLTDLWETYPWHETPIYCDSIPPSYWEAHPEEIVEDTEEPLIGEPATSPYEGLKWAIENHEIKLPNNKEFCGGFSISPQMRMDLLGVIPERAKELLKEMMEEYQNRLVIRIPEDVRKDIAQSPTEEGIKKLDEYLGSINLAPTVGFCNPITLEDLERMAEMMPKGYSEVDFFGPIKTTFHTNEVESEPSTSPKDRSEAHTASLSTDIDDSYPSSSSSSEIDYSDSGSSYDSGGGNDD